jgi:hypothetical protein
MLPSVSTDVTKLATSGHALEFWVYRGYEVNHIREDK